MLISEANVPRRGNTVTRFSSARRLIASRTGVRPISSSRPSASSLIGAPGAMRRVTMRSRSAAYARSAISPLVPSDPVSGSALTRLPPGPAAG